METDWKEKEIVDRVTAFFHQGKTKDLAWRRRQLTGMQLMMEENHERIAEAIQADLGGPKIRSTFDVFGQHEQAQIALDNLSSWAADEPHSHPELLGRSYIRKEPKGVVLVIGPWNFPLFCTLAPLVSIIASGNCAVVKPSEVSVNSSKLIAELIPKYLDNEAFVVVEGGIPETTRLLKERFAMIMYTGNTAVGKIVMKAGAEHLTPCVLELGGKCPVIVDESANIEAAAQRIALSKVINCGQICVSSDYVLCHRSKKAALMKRIAELFKKSFGDDAQASSEWGRIINARHCDRLQKLLDSTNATKISPCLKSGEKIINAETSHMSPTLLDEPSLDDEVMIEEIFGPMLPIIAIDSLEEAVAKVNKVCPQPLALYIFSEKQASIDYVLNNTQSGGVAVNTTVEHIGNAHMSFGGIGTSGCLGYMGKHGFDNFTHKRSILVKGPTQISQEGLLPLPPKDGYPAWLYDVACKIQFGFVPRHLRILSRKQTMYAVAIALILVLRRKLA